MGLDTFATTGIDIFGYPNGRAASIVVAASDASAASKAQADYVCDGTADDVQIQAAIDACEALGFGKVQLTIGNFEGDKIIRITIEER